MSERERVRETGGREGGGGEEGRREGERERERGERERERLVTREPFIISYCTTEYCCIKINSSYCLNQTVIKVRVESYRTMYQCQQALLK